MFRSIFIALSESKMLRAIAERSRIGRRLSSRFVAGMTVDDALTATAATTALGMSVSVDNLGENVTNVEEAHHSAALYHEMLDQLAARKLNANVSMKLTHMGLDVDEKLSREITSKLVEHAARIENFVRVDMEGSAYTEKTLRSCELHRRPGYGTRRRGDSAYLFRSGRTSRLSARKRFAFDSAKARTRSRPRSRSRKKRTSTRTSSP
jgi:proline dehydrogenase